MRKHTLAATMAAALLALTTGCAGTSLLPQATTTVTTTATATASPTTLHAGSLLGFRNALVEAGLICDNWETLSQGIAGKCSDLVLLTVNSDPEDETATRFYYASFNLAYSAIVEEERSDIALLVGDGCFARLSKSDADYLASIVGGVVLST